MLEVTTCKTEVGDFNSGIGIFLGDKDVVKFKISMNYIVTVKEGDGGADLPENGPDFCYVHFSGFQKVKKTTLGGVLEDQNVS